MKTKILILTVLLGFSTVLMAQPADKRVEKQHPGVQWKNRMHNGEHGPLQALNLTDAQKDAFKKNRIAMQKELKPLRNELGEAMAHQRTLVSDDNPNMKAIDKNLEKIGDLKVEMAKIKVKYRLDMRSQLTDEQRMKLDTFRNRMRNQKGEMFRRHFMGMDHGNGLN